MHPILFNLGSYNIYTYALFLGVAYLVGFWFWIKRAKACGVDEGHALTLGIWR